MTKGAIMAFENTEGMTTDGVAGGAVWKALINAIVADKPSTFGYTFVQVTEGSPETESTWHNGRMVVTGLVNTGTAAPGTAQGIFAVYEHALSVTMSGTNPDGSQYHDPGIPWVSYFNGGDALHGFIRASYGFPQSHGCVEMPYSEAAQVYPYTPIGTHGQRRVAELARQDARGAAANMPWRRSASSGNQRAVGRGTRQRSRPICAAARSQRRPRRAYAIDTPAARRAGRRHADCDPATIDVRSLRRYVAALSEQGQAPTTVARKLAALRGLFRSLVTLGERAENPADLLTSPKRPSGCRACSSRRGRGAARPDPGDDAARAARPRAVRARLRLGLRAEELVNLDVERSTSTARRCGSRARAARRGWCRSASTRCARSTQLPRAAAAPRWCSTQTDRARCSSHPGAG